jgi:S1-C subfamily serine protease
VGERKSGPLAARSPRFWRGLSVRPAPPKAGKGVLVDEVEPRGLAWDAGLRPGDVIRKVNDTEVASPSDFRDAVQGAERQDVLLETSRGLKLVKKPPAR